MSFLAFFVCALVAGRFAFGPRKHKLKSDPRIGSRFQLPAARLERRIPALPPHLPESKPPKEERESALDPFTGVTYAVLSYCPRLLFCNICKCYHRQDGPHLNGVQDR